MENILPYTLMLHLILHVTYLILSATLIQIHSLGVYWYKNTFNLEKLRGNQW